MGAVAFQKGLGVTHSCAHALGTVMDMHHGLANGIMIDHALKYNISAVPERFKNMCMVIGLKDWSGEAFIRWLEDLKVQLGIPKKLAETGVKKEHFDRLVKVAIEDVCHPNNPRVCTVDTFKTIFTEAI
jgi:alcohol dehydrogenase class IV